MRFIHIVQAAAAHLLIAAAIILATLPPQKSPDGTRVTRKIDPAFRESPASAVDAETSQTPRFEVTARQEGNRLRISGTVFGGLPCRRLQLKLQLQQESSAPIYHTLTVAGTGGPKPASFRSERRIRGTEAAPAAPWQATVQSHRCLPQNHP